MGRSSAYVTEYYCDMCRHAACTEMATFARIPVTTMFSLQRSAAEHFGGVGGAGVRGGGGGGEGALGGGGWWGGISQR